MHFLADARRVAAGMQRFFPGAVMAKKMAKKDVKKKKYGKKKKGKQS
jgi:hypothetical protein